MFNTPTPYLYLKNHLTFPLIIHHSPSPSCSLHFPTNNTSDSTTSFAVSYLINNFDFTPQYASKLCSIYEIRFQTSEKPDLVLNFFRNNGFSETQLCSIISKAPRLLTCDPFIRVVPKFEFFLSKGASKSDIVNMVSKYPRLLYSSLENHIVPTYELLYRFLQSHTIACAIYYPKILIDYRVPGNIRLLIEIGVPNPNIVRLLQKQSRGLNMNTHCMLKLVEELKDLGFNPSKTTFGRALEAKLSVNKTLWKKKVDAFKKWGWSNEDIVEAFRKRPNFMVTSIDKINLVMDFWVNQLGWDALAVGTIPWVIEYSLERRIIPRAQVVQFLLKKGLREKNTNLTTPFKLSDKLFLHRYIKRYKEESSYLLKLYEEKLTLKDKTDMS
ncbi:hypothetical protein TSUD_301270 [Trifolium subterraneum]|uniref:Transcription regulator mTERF family n=1 Tax=Trifolium subterraneum TaxID=3900 RepID=A0A1B5Z7B9_TRISU|nr:hypothetical protein TSUD_301270 [Trifolium subterraneum]